MSKKKKSVKKRGTSEVKKKVVDPVLGGIDKAKSDEKVAKLNEEIEKKNQSVQAEPGEKSVKIPVEENGGDDEDTSVNDGAEVVFSDEKFSEEGNDEGGSDEVSGDVDSDGDAAEGINNEDQGNEGQTEEEQVEEGQNNEKQIVEAAEGQHVEEVHDADDGGASEEKDEDELLLEGIGIDVEPDVQKAEKEKKHKKKRSKLPIWAKLLIGFLMTILILIIAGLSVGYTILTKTSKVFEGNPLDILISAPLDKDEGGKTNILVFGTSEDAEGHSGAMLTDTILVVSMDAEKKVVKTFSIPRDLWVDFAVTGDDPIACSVGYKGKINATYMCATALKGGKKEDGSKYFAKKVSEVTGLSIHYYIAVDWTVLKTVVDEVGGIDVDVWATSEQGFSDSCQRLKMSKGMNYGINGTTALKLARARNAGCGGGFADYGLINSNFDREINQQRIIDATLKKAMKLGVLANPSKIINLIDSMGKNVRTNITMSELRTFAEKLIAVKNGVTQVETKSQFTTGMYNGQSIVIPAGASTRYESTMYNYAGLQKYLRGQIYRETESVEDEE